MATKLEDYATKYQNIRMERRDGILQVTFHTNGGPLVWTHIGGAHEEFADAFAEIARDTENRVVIMTGTGNAFSGPRANRSNTRDLFTTAETFDILVRHGIDLITNLLTIPAPVISCINGPALRHAELPLLSDIVLCADDATFQDSAHFMNGNVPGDGMNIFFPFLMGYTRGRYFLLTGQELSAQEAKDLGLVNELMPRDQLLPRAWELAQRMVRETNPMTLRYTRMLFTTPLREMIHPLLGYGLAVEGLAYLDGVAKGPVADWRAP